MSVAAAVVSNNGTELNDLDVSINVNCIHNFDPPPPPPTSPESANENQSHDDESETEMVSTTIESQQHQNPTDDDVDDVEPHQIVDHTNDDADTNNTEEVIDMDEDESQSNNANFQPSSSSSSSLFVPNEMSHSSNSVGQTSTSTTITDVFSTKDIKSSNGLTNSSSSTMYFQAYNPPYHEFTIPSFSISAPPPSPIGSTTNLNTCKALMKFEFPELPKLTCQFVEPPAGIQFISLEQFGGKNSKGYNVVPESSTPETSQTYNSQCTALIPYEQRDVRNKSYSKFKLISRRSRSHCPSMIGRQRQTYDERRLHAAANAKNLPVLCKLLESGVDPNAADDLGRTSLHLSACKGHIEAVRVLLQAGADPNKRDVIGNTPLHLAACSTHFDVVTCLLRAGTDVRTLDNRGRNPLQLAQSKLKLIAISKQQPVSEDALKIKMEVQQIIEMMLEYLQKKGQDVEAELLHAFSNRLTLSQTKDEVDAVLENLSSLTLSTPSTTTINTSQPVIPVPEQQNQNQQHQPQQILQPPKLFFQPPVFQGNNNIDGPNSSTISVNINDDVNSRPPSFNFFK